jgi:hypothetical protein
MSGKKCSATTVKGEPCKRGGCECVGGQNFCKAHAAKHKELSAAPECPICLSNVLAKDKTTTACNHTFHQKCLDRWLRRGSSSCPFCRHQLENPFARRSQPAIEQTHPVERWGATLTQEAHQQLLDMGLGQILGVIVQFVPRDRYPTALARALVHPLLLRYLPEDQDTRDLLVEVAVRSGSAEEFMRLLTELSII